MVMYARKHPRSADGHYEGSGRHHHKDGDRNSSSRMLYHKPPNNGKVPYNHGKESNSRHHSSHHGQSQRRDDRSPDRTYHQTKKSTSHHVQEHQNSNEKKEAVPLYACGDWAEYLSSATGRKYYYNCKTEVSQWEKPKDWCDRDSVKRSTDFKKIPGKSSSGGASISISSSGNVSSSGSRHSSHPYQSTSSNRHSQQSSHNSTSSSSGRYHHFQHQQQHHHHYNSGTSSSIRRNNTSPCHSSNNVDSRTLHHNALSNLSPRGRHHRSSESVGSGSSTPVGLVTSLQSTTQQSTDTKTTSANCDVDLHKLLNQISAASGNAGDGLTTKEALKTVQALQYTLMRSGVSIPAASPSQTGSSQAASSAHKLNSSSGAGNSGNSASAQASPSTTPGTTETAASNDMATTTTTTTTVGSALAAVASFPPGMTSVAAPPSDQNATTTADAAVTVTPTFVNGSGVGCGSGGGAGDGGGSSGSGEVNLTDAADCQSPESVCSQQSSTHRLSPNGGAGVSSLPPHSTFAALKSATHTMPPLCSQFYDEALLGHVKGWPTEVLEREKQILLRETAQASNAYLAVAARLKSSRSALRRDDILLSQHVQREQALKSLQASLTEWYDKKGKCSESVV